MPASAERLRSLRIFAQLTGYPKDELGWPLK